MNEKNFKLFKKTDRHLQQVYLNYIMINKLYCNPIKSKLLFRIIWCKLKKGNSMIILTLCDFIFIYVNYMKIYLYESIYVFIQINISIIRKQNVVCNREYQILCIPYQNMRIEFVESNLSPCFDLKL